MEVVVSVLWALFLGQNVFANLNQVDEMYYWKNIQFEDLPLSDDTLIGKYPYHIPTNIDIIGIAYHAQSGVMFTGMGRLRPGIPSTLNAFCTNDYRKGSSPRLWGVPSFEQNLLKDEYYYEAPYSEGRSLNSPQKTYSAGYYNFFFGQKTEDQLDETRRLSLKRPYNIPDNHNVISTYHPIVDDRCNRLFIIDTGIIQYNLEEVYTPQRPTVVVFHIPSNACENRNFPAIKRIVLPDNLWSNPVGFAYVVPDYQPKGTCDDIFLYITNAFDFSLIVYDWKRDKIRGITDRSMEPIQALSNMVFDYWFHYTLPQGILYLQLGAPDKYGNKQGYYAPGASIGLHSVNTKLLKNFNHVFTHEDFKLLGYRQCESQAYRQVIDFETKVMFFGEMQSHRVTCWNMRRPLDPDSTDVIFESDDLMFIPEILIDTEGYLWFITDQVPLNYLTALPINSTEVNSRIYRVKASEAIKGTNCDNQYIGNYDYPYHHFVHH